MRLWYQKPSQILKLNHLILSLQTFFSSCIFLHQSRWYSPVPCRTPQRIELIALPLIDSGMLRNGDGSVKPCMHKKITAVFNVQVSWNGRHSPLILPLLHFSSPPSQIKSSQEKNLLGAGGFKQSKLCFLLQWAVCCPAVWEKSQIMSANASELSATWDISEGKQVASSTKMKA